MQDHLISTINHDSNPHPAIRWMFHATAMIDDYADARDRLVELFDLRVLEYTESTNPGIGRSGGMAWLGDNILEIGEPFVPGAVERFVREHGGGMHSVAVQVSNLDETIAHLESSGVHVAARPGSDFCFTSPSGTAGVVVQWSQFESKDDPRFGREMPDSRAQDPTPVTAISFVGAIVERPEEAAERLAHLFGSSVTFVHPEAPIGEPRTGVSLGDCTLALYAMPGPTSMATYGRSYDRPRTHLLGLQVADLRHARSVVDRVGARVLHDTGGTLLLDPATTGGVQVQLSEALLPNDPRSAV